MCVIYIYNLLKSEAGLNLTLSVHQFASITIMGHVIKILKDPL